MQCLDQEIPVNAGALGPVGLTPRELQILRHLALGKADKQISTDLLISVKTVNHHVSNIILKLDAKNRTHAVAKALLTAQVVMRATDAAGSPPNRRMTDQKQLRRTRRLTRQARSGRPLLTKSVDRYSRYR